MEILRAREAGFCFGVKRAIEMVQEKSRDSDQRVSILKEIVHNHTVIQDFERKGVHSVADLEQAPPGVLVVSAHGVAPEVMEQAARRDLEVLDATCPLVTRIHDIVRDLVRQGYEIFLLGDSSHDEVIGIQGVAPEHIRLIQSLEELRDLPQLSRPVALVSQTTQSRERFEEIAGELQKLQPDALIYNTICDATEKRQNAMRELAQESDLVYVVGSQNSANCNRLREIARTHGIPAYLIEDSSAIDPELVRDYERIGVSAGASTPDELIEGVLARLREIAASVNATGRAG